MLPAWPQGPATIGVSVMGGSDTVLQVFEASQDGTFAGVGASWRSAEEQATSHAGAAPHDRTRKTRWEHLGRAGMAA